MSLTTSFARVAVRLRAYCRGSPMVTAAALAEWTQQTRPKGRDKPRALALGGGRTKQAVLVAHAGATPFTSIRLNPARVPLTFRVNVAS